MKMLKKVLVFAMMLTMLAAISVSAMAHELTVYAGNCGTFDSGSSVSISAANSDYAPAVTVTDSKYFAKGYAVAGENSYDYNGTPTYSTSIEYIDDKDIDYVVVYGVAATQISYTVNYTTANGTVLKAPVTFYANEGDNVTMVVPYIDGYEAVSANGVALNSGIYYIQFSPVEKAEYTIVYQAATTPAANTTTNTTTVVPANTTTGTTTPTAPDGTTTDANAPADNAPADTTETIDENATPQAQPQTEPNEDNTVVIDDNSTPGGNFTQTEVEKEAKGLPLAARFAIGGAGVVVVGLGIFFLVKTLRKKKA